MLRRGLLSLLFSVSVAGLSAQVTLYRFTGTVATVGGDLGSSVQVGDSFTADFQFDEAIAEQFNFGNFALYKSMLTEIRINSTGAGLLTWTASDPLSNDINNGFSVDNNNSGRDAITFSTGTGQLLGPSLNGRAVSATSFALIDNTQTAFSSAGIPSFLNPSAFNSKPMDLKFGGHLSSEIITFNLTAIQKNPSAIPEPSTYAIITGGIALLGTWWQRRRPRAA